MELQAVWGETVAYQGKVSFISFHFISFIWTRLLSRSSGSVFVSLQEYGRGTGADCRRHVQKLNSLRGELLEVETERARTRWYVPVILPFFYFNVRRV